MFGAQKELVAAPSVLLQVRIALAEVPVSNEAAGSKPREVPITLAECPQETTKTKH